MSKPQCKTFCGGNQEQGFVSMKEPQLTAEWNNLHFYQNMIIHKLWLINMYGEQYKKKLFINTFCKVENHLIQIM